MGHAKKVFYRGPSVLGHTNKVFYRGPYVIGHTYRVSLGATCHGSYL